MSRIPADAGAQENIDLVFDDAIPAKSKEQSVAVTGKLKNADGTMLDEVVVTVFDKTTGKRVPAQFKNGLLTFPAIKGNIYAVSVEDSNHNIQSQTITIPADAGNEENIDIVFGDQQSANKNLVSLNGKLTKGDGSYAGRSYGHCFRQDHRQKNSGPIQKWPAHLPCN